MNLEGKTLLITGIGGFIGLRAAELAIARGMRVKGLQRSIEKATLAEQLGAEVVIGDIRDPIAAEKACQGVDIVLHTAAAVGVGIPVEKMRAINVEGTLAIAKAAKKAGAASFVHLSSVMVYGFNYPNQVTETGPFYTGNNPYCKTKLESEQAILPLNHPPEFGVVIIRPGDVYGPRSTAWVVHPLELMQKQKFALINGGRGTMNHVYVDNLIDAIFLAIEKEVYGEAFNITDGCTTTWKEYYTRLAEIGGFPKPTSLPLFMVKAAARLKQNDPDLSLEAIEFLTRFHPYSIEKARSVLGFEPRINLDEGMRCTAEWLETKSTISQVSLMN